MIGRVGIALMVHEALERLRDRWVVVISVLFALLASAVTMYGRKAGGNAGALIGPSLVTLASLFVPLVALVLSQDAIVGERDRNTLGLLLSLPVRRAEVVFAKFVGRGIALVVAVSIGIGTASVVAGGGAGDTLLTLLGPTLLLGLAFLSIGMLISSLVARPVTAASLVVVTWFFMVFFYDLGILGLIVATDGGVSTSTVTSLVFGNPAGLYRAQMMAQLSGPNVLETLGLAATTPSALDMALVWSAWIFGPVLLSGLLLTRKRVLR